MRRAAKVDNTQRAIVDALRAIGCSVVSLAQLGGGVPDLLVGRRGDTWLLEVKTETHRLRESQEAFVRRWRGRPVEVVATVDEALRAVGAL